MTCGEFPGLTPRLRIYSRETPLFSTPFYFLTNSSESYDFQFLH